MLRRAIEQTVSFAFDTKGIYAICVLYFFILVIQVTYLMTYNFFDKAIIISTLLHFIFYLIFQIIDFSVLIRMGSGLKLVPHKLTNNQIQFEGYDKDGKHLFTFIVDDREEDDKGRRNKR